VPVPDRLARAYAYQVLILEELERFGVSVRFLDGPAPGDDPQATLLVQMQGVIAEYEKAKIAERYRRGKLYRARAGDIPFWKVSYGHRRVAGAAGEPARIEISEPEAEVVREIFHAYVERGLSVRQIAFSLREREIPSPTGKPIWGTSTIDRLLRNEAYNGTMYYNRHESIPGNSPRGARTRKTRQRERPREEWIAIPVPPIVERDTFERVKRITRDNSQWNPRGAEPGVWLLRGLVQCGHCHVTCHCQRMRGRNGTFYRYYHCPNHDVLRAGSDDRRCPERNIRADELDQYVFEQVRQALLDPQQLIAAERAVIAGAPDENQLVATQLKRLDTAIATTERERTRLLDAYQAGLIDLDELTRRTATLTARREQLRDEKTALTKRSAELATENRLRRRLAGFAERIAASLDDLDFEGRQRLLRLVVEEVRVTGWRVEIHLKIPLADEPPPDEPDDPGPNNSGPDNGPPGDDPSGPRSEPTEPLSSDMRLRSHRGQDLGVVDEPVDHRRSDDVVAEDFAPTGERLVAGDDHRRSLIAGGDQGEHQVRGLRVERDIAHLIHDQQWDPAQRGELVFQAAVAFGVGEPGDPFGRGAEERAVPGETGPDAQGDAEVRLASTRRIVVALLMLWSLCRRGCG
jgi:site-specific DNA recombinase